MRHIHCDKCKKEMEQLGERSERNWRLEITAQSGFPCNDREDIEVRHADPITVYDLCDTCTEIVCKFIEGIK